MHAAKHTLADAQPRLAPAASPTPLTGFTARPRHWRTRTLGNKHSGWPRAPGLPRRGRGAHSLCHHVPHVAGVQSGVLLLLLRRGVHGKELCTQRRRLPARAQDTALAPPPHHDDNLLPDTSRPLSERPPPASSLELSLLPMRAHVCKLTTHLSSAGAPLLRHRSQRVVLTTSHRGLVFGIKRIAGVLPLLKSPFCVAGNTTNYFHLQDYY